MQIVIIQIFYVVVYLFIYLSIENAQHSFLWWWSNIPPSYVSWSQVITYSTHLTTTFGNIDCKLNNEHYSDAALVLWAKCWCLHAYKLTVTVETCNMHVVLTGTVWKVVSLKWLQFILRGMWMCLPHYSAVSTIVSKTFHLNPNVSLRWWWIINVSNVVLLHRVDFY